MAGAFFAVSLALVAVVLASEEKIFEADGFVITQEDIADVHAKYPLPTAKELELNKRFYYTRALMMRLFAEEARAEGLAGQEIPTEGSLEFAAQDKLYEIYREKLLADTVVPELIIESYYRSYPERFRQDPAVPTEEGGIRILDEKLRDEIRDYIIVRKEQRIETEEVERLKKKYNVRYCEAKKEGSQAQ